MKPTFAGFLVVTTACLVAADDLHAQPVSASPASVEWMAANSPLIVRGVIDEISVHDPHDAFHRYQTVSVRVLETMKGPPSDRNANLLKSLLGDDASWSRSDMRHLIQPIYHESPKYLVRWEAWQVLDGWGYVADQPDWDGVR